MYGWTGGSTNIGRTGGHNFSSARAQYNSPQQPSNSSDGARCRVRGTRGSTPPPVDKETNSESTHPIVIAMDETGSMSGTPALILERLPLLGSEVERYAPNYELCVTAFGNAYFDTDALQVPDFASGPDLEEIIDNLYPEGGGFNGKQTSPLVAYYFLNHCAIPNAVKPIFIIITDAENQEELTPDLVRQWTGDNIDESLNSRTVLQQLQDKFAVYIILRNDMEHEYWSDIIDDQKIVPMHEARDIIELLIGIIANELGEFEDFQMRSSTRHSDRPDRIDRVMSSIHAHTQNEEDDDFGNSSLAVDPSESMQSKRLI